ncbi:MAG: hypothetical protein AAF409_07510 [Pseudomonadota bacterium]
MTHDYDETRIALVRALTGLERARRVAGRTNLPPTMSPAGIRAQIDEIDTLVGDVLDDLAAARDACTRAGRRGLTIC